MATKWNKIDELHRPYYLEEEDFCLYAREYSEGGYEASTSNQLVFNLKKPISYKGLPQWFYKEHAIERFASELGMLRFPDNAVIIPAPTSKPRKSPLFDSRIDDVAKSLCKYNSNLIYQPILDVDIELLSAHSEGGTRIPEEIEEHIVVSKFTKIEIPSTVFVIDDLITTGGHFVAIKRALQHTFPGIKVIGLFWAKKI